MELYYAPTSPFARKVRIAVEELELGGLMRFLAVNPWTSSELLGKNPLSKVPTLVLDDGEALYESSLICDYLDALGGTRRLFPPDGPRRWRSLLRQGLCDGACTAAGRMFADEHRPAEQRSQTMLQRFANAIDSSLDTLESFELDANEFTIGEISMAALLGYLDFRWPERNWRDARPALTRWYTAISQRPSGRQHTLPCT